jgi:hypothetical protein
MPSRRFLCLLPLACAVVLVGSCGEDDYIPTPPPPPELRLARTEDQLIDHFRTAYEDMDPQFLGELLHPDFALILQPQTQVRYPTLGPTLDWTEEMRIASRMFGGQTLTDPDNRVVPGLSAISFQTLERQAEWTDSLPNDPLPNVWYAPYAVTILFDRPGYSTLKVEGLIKFYVASRDSLHGGDALTFWEMVGQQDLTHSNLKAIEEGPWGSVKALFR